MRVAPKSLVVLALLIPAAAQAGLVINEFLPNPDGTDGGQEFVELFNGGGAVINVSGWTLEAGTDSLKLKATIPEGTHIVPGGFLVLGESMVAEADVTTDTLALGNAGSSGDVVVLKDRAGVVIDTVVYGPNNKDGFLDDEGSVAVPGPKPTSGRSLARMPDGADSNDSSVDFSSVEPSPGASNVGEALQCDHAEVAEGLVINEFLADADGSDDGNEWIELYNGSGSRLDLSHWILEAETSAFTGAGTSLPADTLLASGAYLVVGGESVLGRDVDLSGSVPNATSNADGLRISDCSGTPVDTVIYGVANEDGWVGDDGEVASSLAPKPSSGATLARAPNGVDTDASGTDFTLQTADGITPGAANPDPPPCDAGADIVINEFMADPAEDDASYEWVELYNAGDSEITLSGWFLASGTSSLGGGTELHDARVPAGGYYVLGKELVTEADQELKSSLGNASSSSDGLQLRDCEGAVIDTVIYGSPNTDGFVDDTGEVATSLAPAPASGASLSRLQDGYDNDQSKTDFAVEPEPTPGAPNTEREPIVCTPAASETVLLNEAMVNPDGDDQGFEWIELYNPTSAPVRIDGWGISAAGKADQIGIIEASLPGGIEVPAGGFFVFGGADVESVDAVVPLDLGNGSDGDALILYDCEGSRVDSVLYGSNNDDGMTDDRGFVPEQTYASDPSSGASLARVEDGVDSDDAVDWFVDGSPSPGESNFQDPGDGPQPGGRGCGNNDDPPDAGEPRSGCGRSDAPPAMAGMVVLLAGLFMRRRRRGRSR